MPNTKTTNEVPNLSAEDTQSKTYGSAEILSENTVIVFLAAIILMGAAVLFWTLEVGPDISGIYIGICTTTILALILGYRAQSLGARPFRAAYGVAWRIGAAWVVLAAIGEFVATDLTATVTVNIFPVIFIPTVVIVAPTLLIGYVLGIVWHKATWEVIRRDILPIVGILIAVAGLLATLRNKDASTLKPPDRPQLSVPVDDN